MDTEKINTESQYARNLYGIETRITGDPTAQIGALWQRFLSEHLADDIPERLDDRMIAMYFNYEGDQTQPFMFFLGCEVGDVACVPDGFALRNTPVGVYAEFLAVGDMPGALIAKWQQIWAADFKRNFAADYEIHDPATPNEVAIYVGMVA